VTASRRSAPDRWLRRVMDGLAARTDRHEVALPSLLQIIGSIGILQAPCQWLNDFGIKAQVAHHYKWRNCACFSNEASNAPRGEIGLPMFILMCEMFILHCETHFNSVLPESSPPNTLKLGNGFVKNPCRNGVIGVVFANIPLRMKIKFSYELLLQLHNLAANRPSRRAGFSLIEVLTVTAIVGILMGIAVPALSSLTRSTDVGRSAHEVADLLQLARSHAQANNGLVEIGFHEDKEGLSAAVITGRTGMGAFVQLSKVKKFPSVRLDSIDEDIPERPASDVQLSELAGGFPEFTINGRKFDRVIQFNSRGEARVLTNTLTRVIEIDLFPNVNGETPPALRANVAAIQVAGLSGGVTVYRP